MAQRTIHWQPLNVNDVDVSALSFAASTAAYLTKSINTRYSNGYAGLALSFITGTALINLAFQVSLDQQNWFTISTTDGTTLTAAGAIASSVTASSWIVFTPRPSPFTRFSITATSTGTWTMFYVEQQDAS